MTELFLNAFSWFVAATATCSSGLAHERGASMVEYALLVGLIAVVSVCRRRIRRSGQGPVQQRQQRNLTRTVNLREHSPSPNATTTGWVGIPTQLVVVSGRVRSHNGPNDLWNGDRKCFDTARSKSLQQSGRDPGWNERGDNGMTQLFIHAYAAVHMRSTARVSEAHPWSNTRSLVGLIASWPRW